MLRRRPEKVPSLQMGCPEQREIPQGVMGHTYTDEGFAEGFNSLLGGTR